MNKLSFEYVKEIYEKRKELRELHKQEDSKYYKFKIPKKLWGIKKL